MTVTTPDKLDVGEVVEVVVGVSRVQVCLDTNG